MDLKTKEFKELLDQVKIDVKRQVDGMRQKIDNIDFEQLVSMAAQAQDSRFEMNKSSANNIDSMGQSAKN